MSVGVFEDGKYEQNTRATNIWGCRVQPETKGLTLNGVANAYPTGDLTVGLPTLDIRQGKRGFGLKSRTVTVELTADGTGEYAGYKSGRQFTVPVFQLSVWNGYAPGQTGTYVGAACKFISSSSEDLK